MPKVAISVGELYKAIERPVALAAAKALLKFTSLNHESVTMSFPGKAEAQPLYASKENQQSGDTVAHFSTHSKLGVTAVEEYDDSAMMTMFLHENDTALYFHDPELGITIRPVMIDKKVTLSLNYRTNSLKEAETFRDSLVMRISQESQEFLLDVQYDVVLPDEIGAVLNLLHGVREARAGYGDELHEWLQASMSSKQIRLADQAGNNQILAFRERQTGIQGHFEFEEPVKEQRDGATTYLLSMDFVYVYSKPSMLSVSYPMVIHNQLLPSTLFQKDQTHDWNMTPGAKSDLGYRLDFFRRLNGFQSPTVGMKLPYYDEWEPENIPMWTRTILQVLCIVDTATPKDLLNLTQLGKIKIEDAVIDYFKEEHRYLPVAGKLPFHLAVYENEDLIHPANVIVDADLNVRLTKDLDERKQYHVILTTLLNPTKLAGSVVDRLMWNPEVVSRWLYSLPFLQSAPPPLDLIASGKKVTGKSYREFVKQLTNTPAHLRWDDYRIWALVNRFIVKTGD